VRDIIIPQAEQAERAVLGALLAEPALSIDAVRAAGLRASDFGNPQLGAVFAGVAKLADIGTILDGITVFHGLVRQGISAAAVSDLVGNQTSFAPLSSWCSLVRETAARRALVAELTSALDALSAGQPTGEVVTGLGEAVAVASAEQGLGDIVQTDFEALLAYDTKDDPNTVIGDRWLCKGGSLLLNAQSGIGKSSLTMQLAIGWALDPTHVFGAVCTFGMKAIKPLKSLIVQAENDIGDQAQILQSVVCKFARNKAGQALLTQEDRVMLGQNLIFYRDNLHAGAEFLRVLEALVIRHEPDLVWIDPLMCYVGDDLSDQAVVTAFCNSLNRISAKSGCVMCLIHHLPKPKENGARTDSDLAYSGFGSSALTNWAREVATMQRVEAPEGDPPTCSLTMTKRRTRAGLRTADGTEPASRIWIQHSREQERQGMVWLQCDKPVFDDDQPKKRR
jgi:hypothetical protein